MSTQDSTQASYLKSVTKTEETTDEEYKAFSFGRVGSRAQPMLVFRKSDGYVEAISYAKLDRIASNDANTNLKLDFGDQVIQIEGNNLTDLLRYLVANRCIEIVESSVLGTLSLDDKTPVVTKIVSNYSRKSL